MTKSFRQLIRRFLTTLTLCSLFLISACSHQVSGTAYERNAIKITKIYIQIEQTRFNVVGEEFAQTTASGLENGSYYQNLYQVVSEALKANGIYATDIADAAYTLNVRPGQYRVVQQYPSLMKFRYIELTATLFRKGQTQPLWTGLRPISVVPIKAKPTNSTVLQTDANHVFHGNWILGVLNGMQSDGVISLPSNYAVNPKGGRNYYELD